MAELAAGALVSRSLLEERFRQVLGRSPVPTKSAEGSSGRAEPSLDRGGIRVAHRSGTSVAADAVVLRGTRARHCPVC